MVNENDPASIPYVINENGYWYIAYKEKNPYIPYVTVSAKGIANGLSTEINDGADFGPDSYDPTASGSYGNPPYTKTSGIQEAVDYVFYNGGDTVGLDGVFDISDAPLHTDPVAGQEYQIYIPANPVTNPMINISIISLTKSKSGLGGVSSVFTGGAVIKSTNIVSGTSTTKRFILGAFASSNNAGGSNVNIFIDGVGFQTSSSVDNYLGGIDVHGAISASFGIIALNTDFSGGLPASYNSATGIYWMVGGAQGADTYGDNISITGYKYALMSDLPHTHINKLQVYVCYAGILNAIGSNYGGSISHYGVQTTPFGIIIGPDPVPWHIGIYSMEDQATTGPFAYNSSIYTQSTATIVVDTFTLGPSGITPAFPLNKGSKVVIKEFLNNSSGVPYVPTPTISANPPVSGTAYQNTNPYDIVIDLPVYATTAGTAGTVAYGISSTSTVTEMTPRYVNGATSSTAVDIVSLRVPAGWYYEFTGSGVTFGTATVQAV